MNQNSSARDLSVTNDNNLTDGSESDSSIADSDSNANEMAAIEPTQQQSNIGNIQINASNDITIGNRIIYHGPVTIQQQIVNQNRADQQASGSNINRSANILSQPVFPAETTLRIVERSEWFARPPARELEPLELPAIRIIIAYTMGRCASTHRECAAIVRNYQVEHIELNKWDDIGYNFLIGGDGSVYVGRGWDFKGAHSRIYNKRSICIAFIGTFSTSPPPERSLIAAQQLIKRGVELRKIAEDYRLYGHRQLIETISPSNIVYEIIQTWDHWTECVIPP